MENFSEMETVFSFLFFSGGSFWFLFPAIGKKEQPVRLEDKPNFETTKNRIRRFVRKENRVLLGICARTILGIAHLSSGLKPGAIQMYHRPGFVISIKSLILYFFIGL